MHLGLTPSRIGNILTSVYRCGNYLTMLQHVACLNIPEQRLTLWHSAVMTLFHDCYISGVTPMGSGWADPRAPWLRGTQASSLQP